VTTHRLEFTNPAHRAIELPRGVNLSEALDIHTSPILFGCRTGLCGTCLILVDVLQGELPPPNAEELEVLDICAPDEPTARLACQIELTADLRITRQT